MKVARLLVASLLIFGGLLAIAPAQAALDTTWERDIVSGQNGEDVDYVSVDGEDGGTIGIAYHRATSDDVAFASGNASAGFSVKTLDIQSGDASIQHPILVKVSETDWVIAAHTSATVLKIYKSTDSGSTWSIVTTRTSTAANVAYTFDGHGDALVLAWTVQVASPKQRIELSADGGSTWTTSTNPTTTSVGRVMANTDGKYFHATAAGSVPSTLSSVDFSYSFGGGFWSTFANVPGLASVSQSTSVEVVPGTTPSFAWLYCSASCSTTPVYGTKYAYSSSQPYDTPPVSYTVQTLAAASALPQYKSISRNSNQETLAVTQNNAVPSVWYAANHYSALGAVTLPADFPDADNTAVPAIQDDMAYVALSNGDFGGQLEVWSVPVVLADAQHQDTWCGDPRSLDFEGDTDADYGYNYAEDVDFGDFSEGVGSISELEDSYKFNSDDDDFAYLAKGWEAPGATTVRTYFRIEAATDFHDSEFRVGYSFQPETPSNVTKGNGGKPGVAATGNFANFVQARFDESGDDWNMRIQYSNGGSAPATVGQDANSFDPNTPHTFYFEVNTTGNGYARIVDAEGGGIILNRAMVGSGLAGFSDFAGGDPMYSQWFVTMGSSTTLSSLTFLDDNIDNGQLGPNAQDSTCIEFTPSVIIKGDLGSIEGSAVVDLDDIDGDGVNNTVDPDVDGDGRCNDEDDQPVGTPGALLGCTGGDTDDDGDGILDVNDPTPTGHGSGTDDDTCTTVFCVTEATVPEGFTVAAFNGFLGILLVGMIAVGGVGAMQQQSPGFKVGGGVVALFASLGYLMGLYFGLIPMWTLVALVIVSAAFIFIRLKGGG